MIPLLSHFILVASNVNIYTCVLMNAQVGGMFEHAAPTAYQESLNEVVLFGLIGAFLTESTLNATFMRGMSASDVASLFSLPITQKEELSQEHQESGLASLLTVEKRGAMADYAVSIALSATWCGMLNVVYVHLNLKSLASKMCASALTLSIFP